MTQDSADFNERRFIFIGASMPEAACALQGLLAEHPDIHPLAGFTPLAATTEWGAVEIKKMLELHLEPAYKNSAKPLLCDSTANSLFSFELLLQFIPDAKMIHVVMDPRTSFHHLYQKLRARRRREGIGKTGMRGRDIAAAIRQGEETGFIVAQDYPQNVFTLSFERLTANREFETKRLCRFLGIPWTKTLQSCPIPKTEDLQDVWKEEMRPLLQIKLSRDFQRLSAFQNLGYDFSLSHLASGVRRRAKSLVWLQSGFRLQLRNNP